MKKFLNKINLTRFNIFLVILLLGAISFSIIKVVFASTTPAPTFKNNPGHSWAEVSDGTFQVTGPSILRNYTFPDSDAYVLTTPTASGTSGYVLTSTGSGTQTWSPSTTGNIVGTGATNFVTKWTTGGSALGASSIFDAGAGVGIGTSVPQANMQLEVKGATQGNPAASGTTQNGIFRVGGTTNNVLDIGTQGVAPYGTWIQSTDRSLLSSNYNLLLNPNGGNVGIGTTAPAQKLDIRSGYLMVSDTAAPTTSQQAFIQGAPTISYFGSLGTQRASFGNSENYETLTADGNKIGIGVTAPGTKLDVNGDVRLNTGLYVSSPSNFPVLKISGDDNYIGHITHNTNLGPSYGGSGMIVFDSASNGLQSSVGVQKFVRIAPGIAQTLTGGFTVLEVDTAETTVGTGAKLLLDVKRAGTSKFAVDGSGNVGVGTTAPTDQLEITSPTVASGTISTLEMLKLERPINNSVAYPQAASFNLGSYAVNSSGNGYGPKTRLDLNLKSLSANDFVTDKTVATFQDNGNVGIGTTAPTAQLEVQSLTADTHLKVTQGSAAGLDLWEKFSNGAVYFDNYYNAAGSNIYFRTKTSGTPVDALSILSGGNVGVGTTIPAAKLDVKASGGWPAVSGTTQTNGALRVEDGSTGVLDFGSNSGPAWIQATNSGNLATTYSLLLNPNGGNIGIGTTLPGAKLDIENLSAGINEGIRLSHKNAYDAGSKISWWMDNTSESANITSAWYPASVSKSYMAFSTFGPSILERMRINGDGNVGIGTTNPGAALEVNGQVKITGGTPGAGEVLTSDAAGLATWVLPTAGVTGTGTQNYITKWNNAGGTTIGNSLVFDNATNVGIGTTTPQDLFTIAGDQLFAKVGTAGSSYGKMEAVAAGDKASFGTAANIDFWRPTGSLYGNDGEIRFSTAVGVNGVATPTQRMVISDAGNVGIGITAPTSALDIGDGYITLNRTTDPAIVIKQAGTAFGQFRGNGTVLGITNAGGTVYTLAANPATGFVGVGTTAPATDLEIKDAASADSTIRLSAAGNATYYTDIGNYVAAGRGFAISTQGTDALQVAGAGGYSGITLGVVGTNFQVVPVSSKFLFNGGNVGIGTTAPENVEGWNKVLDVLGTGHAKISVRTATIDGRIVSDDNVYYGGPAGMGVGTKSAHPLTFFTNGAVNMTMTSAGNVGVGTTAPTAKLNIGGSAGVDGLRFPDGTLQVSAGQQGIGYYRLTATGTAVILNGNSITKTVTNSLWDSQVYSQDGYTGGASTSFVVNNASNYYMIGLNTDPLLDASYASIDYAWYVQSSGALTIYESNVNQSAGLTATPGDVLTITYDGTNVRYLQNGVVKRTVAATITSPLYFDSSVYGGTSAVADASNIQFGPMMNAGSQWASNGTSIYYNGGKVGIGASAPLLKLDVIDSTATNILATLRRGIQGSDASMVTTFGTPYLAVGGIEYKVNGMQTIGFGYNNGSTWEQPAEIGFQTLSVSGYTSGDIVFANRNGTTNVAPTEVMRITSTGKVGIGTTAPQSFFTTAGDHLFALAPAVAGSYGKLEAAYGGDKLSFGTAANIDFYRNSASVNKNEGEIRFSTSPGVLGVSTPTQRMVIDMNGNVGIGVTAPSQLLELSGNIKQSAANPFLMLNATAGSHAQVRFYSNDVYKGGILKYATDDVGVVAVAGKGFGVSVDGGSTNVMTVQATTGNVGIGTTAPGAALEVNGQVKITGGTPGAGEVLTSDAAGLATWVLPTAGVTGTGTQNYITKWNNAGGTTIADSLIYSNTTGLGIGTTIPSGVLDLGPAFAGRALSWGGTAANYLNIWGAYSNADLVLGAGLRGTTATADGYVSSFSGSVGRSAIRVKLAGGLSFFTDAASVVADGTAITPTERMTILANGNVGIGTTNPVYKLDVQSTATTAVINVGNAAQTQYSNLVLNSDSGSAQIWKDGSGYSTYGGVGALNIYNSTAAPIAFFQAANERMRVAAGGNIGIGTTNPLQLLQVGSSTSAGNQYLRIDAAAVNQSALEFANAGVQKWVFYRAGGSGSNNDLRFYDTVGGADRMTLQSGTGHIGIGTTAPIIDANAGLYMTLDGGAAYGEFSIGKSAAISSNVGGINFINTAIAVADKRIASIWSSTGAATNTGNLDFYTFNAGTVSEKMTILGNGNVGVGNPNPSQLLTVGYSANKLGVIRLEGNASGGVNIQPDPAAGAYNFVLPATVGTAGQVLTSQAGATMTWTTANAGTVTSVSTAAANNGVTATWATATTTPALTIGLGAISPSSVAATGTVTGSNLSGTNINTNGTNTGDNSPNSSITLASLGGTSSSNPTFSGSLKRSAAGTGYLDGNAVELTTTNGVIYSVNPTGGANVPGGSTTVGTMLGIGYATGTVSGVVGATGGDWGLYVAGGTNNIAKVFLDGTSGAIDAAGTIDAGGTVTAPLFSGNLTGLVNVHAGNEMTLANGFAGGVLWLNYGGATGAITQLNVANGMGAGVLASVNAFSFSGAGTGLTGTAANLTAGAVTGMINTSSSADLNTLTTSGFYRLQSANTNFPPGTSTYGQLLTMHGASDTIEQIYGDYGTGHLSIRGGNPPDVGGSGTWRGWLTVYDSGNLTNLSQLTNGPGYITAASLSGYAPLSSPAFTGNPTFTPSAYVQINLAASMGTAFTLNGPTYKDFAFSQGFSNQGIESIYQVGIEQIHLDGAAASWFINSLGVGTNSPASMFSVGASSQFQVTGAGAVTAVGAITAAQFNGPLNGNAATASALTSMNISQFTNNSAYITNVNPYYNVTAGNGYGICFWSSCTNFTITMGSGGQWSYGTVAGYSIHTTMDATADRGFTWGVYGNTPTASLNASTGNFQSAGDIYALGKLGVGTASPSANSTLNVFSPSGSGGGIRVDKTGNYETAFLGDGGSVTAHGVLQLFELGTMNTQIYAGGNTFFNAGNLNAGNLGIGTSNPLAKLNIEGTAGIADLMFSDGYLGVGNYRTTLDTSFAAGTPANNFLKFQISNGTTTGQVTTLWLKGDGNATLAGCLAYNVGTLGTCLSDMRVKKNINDFNLGLKDIIGLNPVTYQYNGLGGTDADGKTRTGLIAQQVLAVSPGFVSTVDEKLNITDAVTQKLFQVDYNALTFALINAVKELNVKVITEVSSISDKLVAIVNRLDGHDRRISELEKQNNALKSLVCLDHPTAVICQK